MSLKKPVVSILLPTHNRADVIATAIASVQAQTFESWELLVVGDGCIDATAEIVQKIAKKDSRIRWFDFPKGPGFGYAHRNTIQKDMQGKYTAFQAHDDLWFPDHLEVLVQYLEANPDTSLAYTRPLWIHPDGTLIPSSFNTDDVTIRQIFMTNHNEIPANCVVHTTESLRKVDGWDASIPKAADWNMWQRIIRLDAVEKIGFIPTPTALHFRAIWRDDANSMNTSLWATYDFIQQSPELLVNLQFAQPTSQKNELSQQDQLWEMVQNPLWRAEVLKNTQSFLDFQARQASLSLEMELELRRIKKHPAYKTLRFGNNVIKAVYSLVKDQTEG